MIYRTQKVERIGIRIYVDYILAPLCNNIYAPMSSLSLHQARVTFTIVQCVLDSKLKDKGCLVCLCFPLYPKHLAQYLAHRRDL